MSIWNQCLDRLQQDLPIQQFSMWIRPLQAELGDSHLTLYAPNRFVLDWVRDKYFSQINNLLSEFCGDKAPQLRFEVKVVNVDPSRIFGASTHSSAPIDHNRLNQHNRSSTTPLAAFPNTSNVAPSSAGHKSNINLTYKFDNFVEEEKNK